MGQRKRRAERASGRKSLVSIFLLLAGTALSAFAADDTLLTLDQAVRIALRQNREILIAEKEISSAAGKTLRMEAVSDPALVFRNEGVSRSASGGEKELSLGVEQSLEFPGKTALRGKIGRQGEEQASLELERVRLLVKARVKRAYYRTALAERTIESLKKTDALLDQFIKDLEVKYQAEAASYSDILRAKVEKARLRNRMLEGQREATASASELNILLGRKSEEPLRVDTGMEFAPLERSLPEVVTEARSASPTLRILASRRVQAEFGLRLSKLSSLPDFALGVYYPSLRWGSWGFSLGVSLPVWRSRRKGELMEAEAANEIAALSIERQERRLEARIESAFASAKAAEAQVQVFEKTLLRDMEDELAAGLSHYQFGKIEFFNLLDLYRTFATVEIEHLNAVYLYLVSLADLEVAGEDQGD